MKFKLNILIKIATALAVAFVVYSCKGKLGKADVLNLKETPIQVVEDMYMVQSKNGNMEMRVAAAIMERYETDTLNYELFPRGFAVYAYDESGLLETEILADEARHDTKKNDESVWSCYGNVVIRNLIKQETMETDTLYWDEKNEKLYTECYVRLYSPDGFMQGYGMESDQRARDSVIKRPFNSYAFVVQDSTEVRLDSVNFIGPLQKK